MSFTLDKSIFIECLPTWVAIYDRSQHTLDVRTDILQAQELLDPWMLSQASEPVGKASDEAGWALEMKLRKLQNQLGGPRSQLEALGGVGIREKKWKNLPTYLLEVPTRTTYLKYPIEIPT